MESSYFCKLIACPDRLFSLFLFVGALYPFTFPRHAMEWPLGCESLGHRQHPVSHDFTFVSCNKLALTNFNVTRVLRNLKGIDKKSI